LPIVVLYTEEKPAINVRRSVKVTTQSKRKFLSENEFQQLLSYVKSQADSARKRGTSRAIVDEIIVLLLIKVGLRPNELCELQIKDLPVIHDENSIWIRNTNEDVVRRVLVSKELADLLTRFVSLYRQNTHRKDLLLQSERGNPISYISLYSKLKRIGEQSGIGQLSPAILRHTYVKRLYDIEQDLRYVQEQAGYMNCRTLYNYVNISNEKTTQKCDACGAAINKGRGKRIDSGQLICRTCQKYFTGS
jgi:integrase/recombinase XerD